VSKKRKSYHDDHMDETWLIPYADLLTLLLALFIILFASSQTDSKKYDSIMRSLNSAFTGGVSFFDKPQMVPIMGEPAAVDVHSKTEDSNDTQSELKGAELQKDMIRKETAELQELKQQLDQYISDNQLLTQLETNLTTDMLMITIRDNALFASGSATVKPEAQKLAVAISDMLTQYPQYQIEVAGHTDNVPIRPSSRFKSNDNLSLLRAEAVRDVLAATIDDATRITVEGRGEGDPVADNATEEGRAQNRRVEVLLRREGSWEAPVPPAPGAETIPEDSAQTEGG